MFALGELDLIRRIIHLNRYKIALSINMKKVIFTNFFEFIWKKDNPERPKHHSAPIPEPGRLERNPQLPKPATAPSTPQLVRDVGPRARSVRGSVDVSESSEALEPVQLSYSPGSGRGSSPLTIKKRGRFLSGNSGDKARRFSLDVVGEISLGIERESVGYERGQAESENKISTVRDLPYFYDSLDSARKRLSDVEGAKPGDYVLVRSSMIDHVMILVREDRRTATQTMLQMLGDGACVPVDMDGRLGFEYASIDRYVEANVVNKYKSARPLTNDGMKGRLLNVDLLGTESVNFYDIDSMQAKELLLLEKRGTYLLRKASVPGNFVTFSMKPFVSKGEGVIENVRLKLDDDGACVPVDEKTSEPVFKRKYASVALFVSESYGGALPYRPRQMTGW